MANQTTQQKFQAFCDEFKYFSANELDLNDDGTIINLDSLIPNNQIPIETAIVYHPEKITGVFIHSDGYVFELINAEYFYAHIANADIKSASIVEIFLELFAFVEGCAQLWLDAMIRLDNERIFLLKNIQNCDKNGSWFDPILEYPDMNVVSLEDCLEWINNNCG